jgi:hypothetical protein
MNKKFSDEEIERNRVKHKYVFEKALKCYLNSNMKINDFILCFVVRYNANDDDNDLNKLYSFEIERINDKENEDHENSNEENDDDNDNKERSTPLVINNEKYERIIECLINPDLCTDPNFKHWVLKKGEFSIIDLQLTVLVQIFQDYHV